MLLHVRTIHQISFLAFIFLLRKLQITNAVLLLDEHGAKDAIAASCAITTKGTVTAVLAIKNEPAAVTVIRIIEEVAKLIAVGKVAVDREFVMHAERSKERLLVEVTAEDEVAVLVAAAHVAVVAVLAVDPRESKHRDIALEFGKLFEKRSSKIKITAEGEWIPSIRVPAVGTVNLIRFPTCDVTDHVFFTEITGAPVKLSAIAKCDALLVATQ